MKSISLQFFRVSLNAFILGLWTSVSLLAGNPVKSVIPALEGEKWWGAVLMDGDNQPFVDFSSFDLASECHDGQTTPLLVSSKGRYVWSDRPFVFSFQDGDLTIDADAPITPIEAGSTLREAYLAASAAHFPFDGRTPPEEMFCKPQFNNWIAKKKFFL